LDALIAKSGVKPWTEKDFEAWENSPPLMSEEEFEE